ncbi:MAG: VOC family protein [Hyphomicrobiaceae bacterium]
MKIKRIEHIAIALKSMNAVKDVLENKLGIAMEYDEHLPAHRTTLAMYPIGETYLELLQSDNPDGQVNQWIKERGEGLFHICLEVEDIDASIAELKEKGIRFTSDVRIGHGNSRIVFMDPATTGGLVIELAELPKDAHHGHGGGHKQAAE